MSTPMHGTTLRMQNTHWGCGDPVWQQKALKMQNTMRPMRSSVTAKTMKRSLEQRPIQARSNHEPVRPFAEIAFCASRTHFVWKNITFSPPVTFQEVVPCHQILPLLRKMTSQDHQIPPLPRKVTVLCCSFTVPFFTWLFNLLFLKSPYIGSFSTKLLLTNRNTSIHITKQKQPIICWIEWPDQA